MIGVAKIAPAREIFRTLQTVKIRIAIILTVVMDSFDAAFTVDSVLPAAAVTSLSRPSFIRST